eukprot:TRINITY_DN3290_c0_g2_i1.p1 TRINITY_DN3290_c0_g2~~TRINITY_DN3290_c0_g2_i1.p1  ORF type:complete len:981 (+),score=385.15 TRINITY_DN3290_c0_g2_i1:304-3246(+)
MDRGGLERKLRVQVVQCSGEDESFPAVELTQHTVDAKGWQSPKFAEFPLEIGLRLEGEAHIEQMQFLSHESKIATKIEVFISEPTPESRRTRQFPTYDTAVWRRLGFLSLLPNEQSEYLARELKTVHVTCQAVHVRLLLHKCHVNSYNFFNQVGLIAVNIVGKLVCPYQTPAQLTAYEVAARSYMPSDGPDVPLKSITPPNVSADDYDGKRMELQFDAVTIRKLRELSIMKQRAVAEEDYDTAKRFKEQIAALKQVGSRLMQLEGQKKTAVQNEDYDQAKALKAEIDQLRAQAMGFGRPSSRGADDRPSLPQHLPPMYGMPQNAAPPGPPQEAPPLPPIGAGQHDQPSVGAGLSDVASAVAATPLAPRPPSTAYDDRPLPAPPPAQTTPQQASNLDDRPAISRALASQNPQLPPDMGSNDGSPSAPSPPRYRRNIEEVLNDPDPFNTGQRQQSSDQAAPAEPAFDIRKEPDWAQDVHSRVVALHSDSQTAPPLLDAKAREYSEYGLNFGEFGMRCLFSRQRQTREAVLKALAGKLAAGSGDPAPFPGDRRPQVMLLLKYLTAKGHGLHDAVPSVIASCAEALRVLLASDLPAAAAQPLQNVAGALLPKAAEVNPRTRELATELLMTLAACPVFGVERVAACVLHEPEHVKKEAQVWRQLHARANLAMLLLDKFGVARKEHRTGLSPDAVMTRIVTPALQSSQEEVRKAAVKICGMLHHQGAGKVVERHTQMLKPTLKAAISKECSGGGDSATERFAHEREMMSSSISVDGDEEMKRQMRAARSAARQATAAPAGAQASRPSQQRNGYSPQKPATTPPAGGASPYGNTAQTVPAEATAAVTEDDETVCRFCGLRDPRFTEQVLDAHYLHSCPALSQCPYCEQVIEIMMLTEHWTDECEKRVMQQCPRCREAVHADSYEEHVAAGSCIPHDEAVAVCVLCQARLPATEEGWEQHLLHDGCPRNPRGKGQQEGVEFQLAANAK